MELYEYIFFPINIIPEEIVTQYNLRAMGENGYVYADIIKVMYVLPQAGQIVNYFLTKNISTHSY